jgi:hypothetical protein
MQVISAVTTVTSLMSSGKSNYSEHTSDTLSNLKLIGTVKENEKIHVKSLSVKQINIFTAFERLIYREDKNLTRTFLNNTISHTFDILGNRIKDKTFAKNIIVDLINSTVGLRNQQLTYKTDRDFVCKIDTLIQRIEEQLSNYRSQNEDLFQSLPENTLVILKELNHE